MRAVAVVLAMGLATACSRGAGQPSSGIVGTVRAGPTCPVERADSPCPPRAWTGTVRASAGGASYEAETDNQGRFAIDLPPGTYEIVAVTEGGPPTGVPTTVTVRGGEGQPARVDLTVDTGIR
jgi:Carboxypeptidase regulatory-like domain